MLTFLVAEFTDSTSIVSNEFVENTILIDRVLFEPVDSVFIRFMAFGYDFPLKPEMKGHSVFEIDEVKIDFISSSKSVLLENSKLQIYPNPSTGIFNLEINQELRPNEIEVYDLLGRRIEVLDFASGIDCSYLGKGAYFIFVTTDMGRVYKKVIIL